jgi:hypothetical protein
VDEVGGFCGSRGKAAAWRRVKSGGNLAAKPDFFQRLYFGSSLPPRLKGFSLHRPKARHAPVIQLSLQITRICLHSSPYSQWPTMIRSRRAPQNPAARAWHTLRPKRRLIISSWGSNPRCAAGIELFPLYSRFSIVLTPSFPRKRHESFVYSRQLSQKSEMHIATWRCDHNFTLFLPSRPFDLFRAMHLPSH